MGIRSTLRARVVEGYPLAATMARAGITALWVPRLTAWDGERLGLFRALRSRSVMPCRRGVTGRLASVTNFDVIEIRQ